MSIRNAAIIGIVLPGTLALHPHSARPDDRELRQQVNTAIERGRDFLIRSQQPDGRWAFLDDRYPTGGTGLALLALINSGLTRDDATIRSGLQYLRASVSAAGLPKQNYELALMIMALVAADDDENPRNAVLISELARQLEANQNTIGPNAGLWSYEKPTTGGDRSNGQFAVLGLRDAALYGVPIKRRTWERVHKHWVDYQNPDGGWSYALERPHDQSTGSMTAAGVATLAICETMLRDAGDDVDALGRPNCCQDPPEPNEALEKGIQWLDNHFVIGTNPSSKAGNLWTLYYHYAIERAGRLNRIRFFRNIDWYREGARFYINGQRERGDWKSRSQSQESDPVVATSLSLLFLSKGLSPVLMNKLEYGPRDPARANHVLSTDWNNHRNDVANLTDMITRLPKWPKLMTSQVVNIHKLRPDTAIEELMQSKILVLTGSDRPEISDEHVAYLREYIDQGGFLFAVRNCDSTAFDKGFRELIGRLYPDGDAELRRLDDDHPIFRSEFPFDGKSVELWGVDFGCRTAIVYSPADIGCFWDKWAINPPKGRSLELSAMITRNMRIGVNVVAYATGREPPNKLDVETQPDKRLAQDQVGATLRIAKLRHEGGWDTAPQALQNLIVSLNDRVGLTASSEKNNLQPIDPSIKAFPLVYMHGRFGFSLTRQEREQLRKHLDNGAVLFADACCGADLFDKSFRDQMELIYPDHELKQIPVDHEIFNMTTGLGHRIEKATRRVQQSKRKDATLESSQQTGPPFLEGIEIDGRYAVIYSKYDISCALERQSTVACSGYVPEDALRIAVNIVLYSMLQDVGGRRASSEVSAR